jgi:ribonuclease T1
VKWLAAAALAFCTTVLAHVSDIQTSALPPEARQTLALIKAGGPFPYQRDGAVFGNRESLLPKRERGYYREYTVKTPGAKDRGARRIVGGRGGEYYYTDDHYRSFRRIIE